MASVVVACSENSPSFGWRSFIRKPRGIALAAIGACLSVAAGAWIVAALATVQTMTPAATDKQGRLQASLDLPSVARPLPVERNIRVRKFARLSKTPADQLWPAGLTVAVIKEHYDRRQAQAVARIERQTAKTAKAYAVAAASRTKAGTIAEANASVQPTLVSALVDPGVTRASVSGKPFSLVMAEEARDAVAALPDTIPLPEARPKALAKIVEEKPQNRRTKPAARELAYASPAQVDSDDEMRETKPGLFGGSRTRSRGRTAYYDISAGVVHLPNGERLEAHSGIGKMRDNPKYVHMKMRGSTPPGTFKLTMREKLFHGVEALRMTPVDGVHPHGRTGLLTHSYLLGRNGNSHGCVAFKNYPRFLAAFKRGEIDTLVVFPSMSSGKTRLASLFGGKG